MMADMLKLNITVSFDNFHKDAWKVLKIIRPEWSEENVIKMVSYFICIELALEYG